MKKAWLGLFLAGMGCGTPDADKAWVTPEDRFVDVRGVNLHYRDYGGDGDLMVLVPSFGMTAHVFDPIAPHLTDRYRVVAFTRRWHGTSDTTDLGFDLDTLVSDLAGFIDEVADSPAIVVGWSWAGLELPKLARQRPDLVKTLIFANAVWEPMPSRPDLVRPGMMTTFDSVYPNLEAAVDQLHPLLDAERDVVVTTLAPLLREREDGTYVWAPPFNNPSAEQAFFALESEWSEDYYEGLDLPVLAIRVQQNHALEAEMRRLGFGQDSVDAALRWATEWDDVRATRGLARLDAAVPEAEIVVLDRVSHNFVVESPDVVAEVILEYLDGLADLR